MSGAQIGTVIGGAVGAFFGGPAGAQLGMAIGGAIGGAVDPTQVNGPHIGDGQQQSATDGSPISWVLGTAKIAGTVVWAGERYEVKIKDSGGKGGPSVSHYESRQSFAVCVCESSGIRNSVVADVLMVEQDGVIVYDARPDSQTAEDSQKWKRNIDFTFGAEDQLAHPTIEASVGADGTPAYRGRLMMIATDFDIYSAGDRIPNFVFLVTTKSTAASSSQGAGKEAWPDKRQIPTAGYTGKVQVDYDMRSVPDKLQVLDGEKIVVDTGYRGSTSLQTSLNSALVEKGAPPEQIVGPGAGTTSYIKNSWSRHIDILVWGPLQGTAWSYKVSFPSPLSRGITLHEACRRIVNRGGLNDGDIAGLENDETFVEGYSISRQCSGTDALRPLLQAYFCFGSEYDGQIHFHKLGEDASLTVDPAHLIIGNDATGGAMQETTRNQATEFPRRTIGRYTDPGQNYNVVTVMSERNAVDVVAIGEQQFDMPVVMNADEARKAVDKALKVSYASLEGTREYVVPFSYGDVNYLQAFAGMPVLMEGRRWIIDDMTVGNNFLKFSTRYDRQSAYTSNLQAVKGVEPTPPVSRYGGPTEMVALNLFRLRSEDTVGIYISVKGHDPGWRKADIQISYDDRETWELAIIANTAGTFGTVVGTLPPSGEPLVVEVGDGTLENATSGQLEGGANAFAVARGSDVGSVCQFQYAEEDSDEEWVLTGITDELKGSPRLEPSIGDKFVMLDNVYFLPVDDIYDSKTIWLRATANGENPDEQPTVSIVYHADIATIVDGGDLDGDDNG